MSLLADRHQADLFYSLQLLFEDRLGWPVRTPVGLDWWTSGVWRFGEVFGDDRLARQYLAIGPQWREVEDGLYLTFDSAHPERPLYGVTLARAEATAWAGVLASVQENQAGFARFAAAAGARYLYHVGNARQQVDLALDPLVLDSTGLGLPGRAAAIRQEFDADGIFRYRPPERTDRVASFVNLAARIPEVWAAYGGLAQRLPEYRFRAYGHDCPDGFLAPAAAIADEMARTGWAFHDKPTGDGFGHVIHNWAAIGRPLIGHARYYAGQPAAIFWRDGETCIDLDRHSLTEAAALIRATSPARHAAMCQAIRRTFEEHWQPVADAARVRALIG